MPKNCSRAFTLFELLIVILIIAVLASIAYPGFITTLERAKVVKDMNNLRQIGLATLTYLNDNSDVIPASLTWPGTSTTPVLYPKYISTRKIFQSPFDNRPNPETDSGSPVSYGINENMYATDPTVGVDRSMARVVCPACTILMAPNYPNPPGDPTQTTCWPGYTNGAPNLPVGGGSETKGTQGNGTQINALFCDSHIESLKFGPSSVQGTFQNPGSPSDPIDQKHWNPTIK
jgi:prepilin-type N-terminal cleavage/methylation domain-containing protein